MLGSVLTWEVPFLYRIKLHLNCEKITSQVESLLTGMTNTSPVYGLDQTNLKIFLMTKSPAFPKFFKILPQNLSLVYIKGLQGGGSGKSKDKKANLRAVRRNSRNSMSVSVPATENALLRLSQSAENNSKTHYKNTEKAPLKFSQSTEIQSTNLIDIEVNAEEIKEKSKTQSKASVIADNIANQMRIGILDVEVLDELLEISPYKCVTPYSIFLILISSFDSSRLWICEHWIEERAKISRICRKFLMADFFMNKNRAFITNNETDQLVKRLTIVRSIIDRNKQKLPEICTLIEVNVMITILSNAKSIESVTQQVISHCGSVFKVLLALYKRELGNALNIVIDYIKKISFQRRKGYEDYLLDIDFLENIIEIDPDPMIALENFIKEQMSEIETLGWEKQHILIGFICENIVKKKVSIDFSLIFLNINFIMFVTSNNPNIRQKAAICIRYFIGSDVSEIKKLGNIFRNQLISTEKMSGIVKILNFHAITSIESSILRKRSRKRFDLKVKFDTIKEMMEQALNGDFQEKKTAQKGIKKQIRDIKNNILKDAFRKKNEIIKILCRMMSELDFKQDDYVRNRMRIITDEEWAKVSRIQNANSLTNADILFTRIESEKEMAETGMNEIGSQLRSNSANEQTVRYSLIELKQLYNGFKKQYEELKKNYSENSEDRKVLNLTRESLVQKILDSPLPVIDFSKSKLIAAQKERNIDLWFDEVGSTLEDLNFEKVIGLNAEDNSLFDNQKRKYDELKVYHDNIKIEINNVQNEIDSIEVILRDYFFSLNNNKPRVMQNIENALRSLDAHYKRCQEVTNCYAAFREKFKEMILNVKASCPHIQISTTVYSKFTTPWQSTGGYIGQTISNSINEMIGDGIGSGLLSSFGLGGSRSSNPPPPPPPSYSYYNPNQPYIINNSYPNPPPSGISVYSLPPHARIVSYPTNPPYNAPSYYPSPYRK